MPKLRPIQNSFATGEISPRMAGRVDEQKYFSGCETLENFTLFPHGGAERRWGLHFVAAAKYPNKKCRLVPFEFSTIQAYVLEFGDAYIRFFKERAQILSGGVPYEIASPYREADLPLLKFAQSADVLYIVHPDYAPRKLSRTGHTSWTLTAIDFTNGPFLPERTDCTITPSATSGTVSLAASADIFDIGHVGALFKVKHTTAATVYTNLGNPDDSGNWVQTRCTMAQVNDPGNGPPGTDYYYTLTDTGSGIPGQRITRLLSGLTVGKNYRAKIYLKNGTASWASCLVSMFDNALNLCIASQVLASYPGWTLVTLLFTATETNPNIVIDTAVGMGLNLKVGSIYIEDATAGSGTDVWGVAKVTAFGNARSVTAEVLDPFGDITAGSAWREGSWSAYRGYPVSVTFFEQRSFWGGNANQPQTLWGSKSGDFENMDEGTGLDDEGLNYTISTAKVDAIRWLCGVRVLIIGTVGGIHKASGTSAGDALTPTNISIKPEVGWRAENIEPFRVGSAVLYVQKGGRKVRELAYNWQSDAYLAPDLSIISEHLTAGGITAWDYQQETGSIVWCVRGDGHFLPLTYLRDHDVVGWAHCFTDGVAESVCCIPSTDDDWDETWFSIERTIGGVAVRYIEYLDPDLYVDSGLSYSGVPISTITLAHLVGETVQINGDGMICPSQTVPAGGVLTLPRAAAEIQAGLGYSSKIVTVRPEASLAGTIQGLKKRWARVFVRLYNSLGCKINGHQLPFRRVGDAMDAAPAPLTGDHRVSNLGFDRDGRITIEQAEALPLTVLAVFGTLEQGDE